MSASLVGSEMCIRDRANSDQRARWRNRCGSLWIPENAKWLKRPKLEPVSYTHLTLPTICSV
eukprot:14281357-Alexandrium_andersonii.AAC.1